MAYLTPDDDELKQQQQQGALPSMRTSGSDGAMATGKGAGGAAPAPGAPTNSGSYVNLQSFLGANNLATQANKVKAAGNSIINSGYGGFRTAADPLMGQSFTPTSYSSSDLDSASNGDTAALGRIKSAASQSYNGPTSFSFKTSEESDKDISSLGNPNTISDVLARDPIKRGTYGAGLRSLDSAINTASPQVHDASSEVTGRYSTLQKYIGDEGGALNSKLGGLKTAADDARTAAIGGLTSDQARATASATERADSYNAAEKQRRKQYIADHWRELNGGPMGAGPQPGNPKNYVTYAPGTGPATASNTMTPADENRFKILNEILGGGIVADPTAYKGGVATYSENIPPGQGKKDTMAPNPKMSEQQLLDGNRAAIQAEAAQLGLTPEEFEEIRKNISVPGYRYDNDPKFEKMKQNLLPTGKSGGPR